MLLAFAAGLWIAFMGGCARVKTSATAVMPRSSNDASFFVGMEDRALTFTSPAGWVISCDGADCPPVNQGDSLLFTGLATYAMDCTHGDSTSLAMAQMVDTMDGGLYRHPSLPSSISLDGALGFYRGATKRATLCGEGWQWGELIKKHLAYVMRNEGVLNVGSSATLAGGFSYIPRKLASNLGVGEEPSAKDQAELEAAVAGWAAADMAAHGACFRLNLGLMALQTVEELGSKISPEGKAAYCAATRGSRIPTIDQWCGRGGLLDYINGFAYNVWQYRHQRCTDWETPDGSVGADGQPGVDFLTAWADYNNY
jgi:hypothetical protein